MLFHQFINRPTKKWSHRCITQRLVERELSRLVSHPFPTKTNSSSIPPCWALGSQTHLTLSSPVFICVVYCLNCCSCRPGHASVHQNRTVTRICASSTCYFLTVLKLCAAEREWWMGVVYCVCVCDESAAEDTVSIPPHTHTTPNKTRGQSLIPAVQSVRPNWVW